MDGLGERGGLGDLHARGDRASAQDSGRDDGRREAEPGGLGESPMGPRHRTHFSREPHLAEGDRGPAQGAVGGRAGQRQGDREICRGLGQPGTADRRQEDIVLAQGDLGPTPQDGEDHVGAGPVQAGGRTARVRVVGLVHEPLHLGDHRTATLERDGDAGPGHRRGAVGEEEATRVSQTHDADIIEVEAAHLVGRAEAVLDRPDQTQPTVPVTLELHDDVDQVLEHPGPCDGTVLGHVPHEEHGDAARLGDLDERGGDLAHLRDVARGALDLGAADRLHRVDNHERWIYLLDLREDGAEVGLGGEVEAISDSTNALGAATDLRRRLLAGDVENCLGHGPRRVRARALVHPLP